MDGLNRELLYGLELKQEISAIEKVSNKLLEDLSDTEVVKSWATEEKYLQRELYRIVLQIIKSGDLITHTYQGNQGILLTYIPYRDLYKLQTNQGLAEQKLEKIKNIIEDKF